MDKAGFDKMLEKQKLLTGALESLLQSSRFYRPSSTANAVGDAEPESDSEVGFRIITPAYPFRGTQLSLLILPRKTEDGAGKGIMPRIFNRMLKKSLVGDEREPSVIRLSPVVLYNTFAEVGKAVKIIEESLEEEVELERQNGSSRDAEIGSANVDMTTKG
jgi:kynureninase